MSQIDPDYTLFRAFIVSCGGQLQNQPRKYNSFAQGDFMAMEHEFGILDHFDRQYVYNDYTPWKFDCFAVHDDLVSSLAEKLSDMETYFHSLDRREQGLALYGITIIPPKSLPLFYDAVTSSEHFNHSDQLRRLASKINQAQKENKHMIHFGI
jgi:hypothetical protein